MTYGPQPLGRWSSSFGSSLPFPQLGMRYRVIREFKDHDGDVHPEGEEWTFLGSSFVPYHSGLGLVVSFDDQQEWLVSLLAMPEGQGHVVDNFEQYIAPVEGGNRLQYHPQLPSQAPAVKKPVRSQYSEDLLIRALPWLIILLGPFLLMNAYMWIAHKLHHSSVSADLIAMAVSVLAGAVVLKRTTRADRVLWLVLYVPIAALAVFGWAFVFH